MAEKPIGVGMIGCGTVGGGVAQLLREQAELYAQRLGRPVELRKVLVRRVKRDDCPVDAKLLTASADDFFATPDMPIVVEVAGGIDPVAGYVRRALEAGKHVVTANKSLLADQGPELFALARKHHAAIAFEASCAGGIPIITALKFGLMANRIDALYGILNGTCNYILTEMTQRQKAYADALGEAQQKGFAEADPTLDVSGRDAAQKLAILAMLAFGVRVRGDEVWSEGIDNLDIDDIRFARELGYDVKLLAIAQRLSDPLSPRERAGVRAGHPGENQTKHASGGQPSPNPLPGGEGSGATLSLRVHPAFVRREAPLAQVHGSLNAVSVLGHAVGHTMYQGRGAGRLPTASAVVSDLLNVASGWYASAFSALNIWPDLHQPAALVAAEDLTCRFYIRINALDVPGVMAKVSAILGDAGISLSALMQHESNAGQFVPVVITTHEARQGDLFAALDKIGKLDVVSGKPVRLRIVED